MKSLRLLFFLVIAAFITALLSECRQTGSGYNTEAEKLLIEKAVNNCIGWAKTKDLGLLYSVIANDTNFIEVHPEGKVVRGFNDFKKNETFWMKS